MEQDVYICVGFPESEIHVANMVKTSLEKCSAKDAAKKLRKDVAENPKDFAVYNHGKIAPAELYWAVFDSVMAKTPILASDNFWCRDALKKEHEEKVQREAQEHLARYEALLQLTEDDKEFMAKHHRIPDEDKCPNCGCHGFDGSFCVACDSAICPDCRGVLDESGQCDNCGYGL